MGEVPEAAGLAEESPAERKAAKKARREEEKKQKSLMIHSQTFQMQEWNYLHLLKLSSILVLMQDFYIVREVTMH